MIKFTASEQAIIDAIQSWLIPFDRELPGVIVPIYNAWEDVIECVQGLLDTTPPQVPLILLDDASTDPRIPEICTQFAAQATQQVSYFRLTQNVGFVGNVNIAFAATMGRDVVLVNSDIITPQRWLERLQAAAYVRSNVATATPLTNHGSILSVPYRNRPTNQLVDGLDLTEIDARIERVSSQLRPLLPTGIGHCLYLRRSALDVVGYFDRIFDPGYGEEVDLCQRAVIQGFVHVAADDLFVFHKGSRSFSAAKQIRRQQIQVTHDQILDRRYPWYLPWVRETEISSETPLAQALNRASRALLSTQIALDLTYVSPTTTGTSVVALELLRALDQLSSHGLQVTAIVLDSARREFRRLLENGPGTIQILGMSDIQPLQKFDVIFRPAQLNQFEDLQRLYGWARRVVVFQLDFIAYGIPTYAADYEGWRYLRRLTEQVMAVADGIAFLSEDVAKDAVQHGFYLAPERTCVLYAGVDHLVHNNQTPVRPDRLTADPGAYLLMLGANFKHKNRVHSIRLFGHLMIELGWDGWLVLAGPTVSHGGSVEEERIALQEVGGAGERILDLGIVREDEKQWLLQNAGVVLYPSVIEGFGLIPFEAAAWGTPTLTTRSTSLVEVLGDDVIYFEGYDPLANARLTREILQNPNLRHKQVEAIRKRSQRFSWGRMAEQTLTFLEQIVKLPAQTDSREMAQAAAVIFHGPPPPFAPLPFRERWRVRFYKARGAWQQGGMQSLWQEINQYIIWKRRTGWLT